MIAQDGKDESYDIFREGVEVRLPLLFCCAFTVGGGLESRGKLSRLGGYNMAMLRMSQATPDTVILSPSQIYSLSSLILEEG